MISADSKVENDKKVESKDNTLNYRCSKAICGSLNRAFAQGEIKDYTSFRRHEKKFCDNNGEGCKYNID